MDKRGEEPPTGTAGPSPSEAGPDVWVGPYRLLERIGEGGFGTVYRAEQRAPVQRRVALKIIKHGMDTRQVIARFEAERQALAMMDHPNIATVLDAGATPKGRPYFVMELVHGDPITDYCDTHTLDIVARLNLFVHVCHAVQHAHQKGIIHRDLKPGNVLVSVVDGGPVPKIIDFGIAKATTIPLTDKTVLTELHQAIGTPEYMSPEQAEMSGVDIDTRADVYSLGVLLYELLTSTTPIQRDKLPPAGWAEMQRIIRDVEPPTPSTRLQQISGSVPTVASRRHTDGARLQATIRGDLDWIVMKCLEKDRTRRYATVNALAMDVERYLAGEPVTAAPPSPAYRLRKFVARNRGAVAAAAAIVVLLGAGTSFGLYRAEARRSDAEVQRLEAQNQKESAEQVLRVFKEMLQGVKAEVARGRDTALLRQILDSTRTRIEGGEFKTRPAVDASLRQTMGLVYLDLGDIPTAQQLLSEALRLVRERPTDDVTSLANAMTNLAGATYESGRPREAERLFRDALELHRRVSTSDSAHVANSLNNLGSLLDELGRHEEAESTHREGLAMRERLYQADHSNVALAQARLAKLLLESGRPADAVPPARDAAAMFRRLYKQDHAFTVRGLDALANVLAAVGQHQEAEAVAREALAMAQRVFPGDHPDVAQSLQTVSRVLAASGRTAEALPLAEQSAAMARKTLPAAHPSVAEYERSLQAMRAQAR